MFSSIQNSSSMKKRIHVNGLRHMWFKWSLKKYLTSYLIWIKRMMKFMIQRITSLMIFILQKNWKIFENKNCFDFKRHIEFLLINWHCWLVTSLLLHKTSFEKQQSLWIIETCLEKRLFPNCPPSTCLFCSNWHSYLTSLRELIHWNIELSLKTLILNPFHHLIETSVETYSLNSWWNHSISILLAWDNVMIIWF